MDCPACGMNCHGTCYTPTEEVLSPDEKIIKEIQTKLHEIEAVIKKAVPILRERACRLNMEWYTASGNVLKELADELEALL